MVWMCERRDVRPNHPVIRGFEEEKLASISLLFPLEGFMTTMESLAFTRAMDEKVRGFG